MFKRWRRGQAIVETAIVLPMLLIVIFGIVGVGVEESAKSIIYSSAGEGARIGAYYGVTMNGSTCSVPSATEAKISKAVTDNFAANHLSGFHASRDLAISAQPTTVYGTGSTAQQCLVTVSIQYPWHVSVPLYAAITGHPSGAITLTGEATYDANTNS